MSLSNLRPRQKKPARKRRGRGPGSGLGTYGGRGLKGQKSRTGGSIRPGFEGGRMPLIRQLPKIRGFRSIQAKAQIIKLDKLAGEFESGALITSRALQKKGLIDTINVPVKILGKHPINKRFELKGIQISAGARQMLEKAGGKVTDVQ